ncbi:MAG: hypothetical protein LQ344_008093 [Seirophora lacunosa]|nr:MAG: hypothetical protein LQ344_008093 [Seirophora lacunosa]
MAKTRAAAARAANRKRKRAPPAIKVPKSSPSFAPVNESEPTDHLEESGPSDAFKAAIKLQMGLRLTLGVQLRRLLHWMATFKALGAITSLMVISYINPSLTYTEPAASESSELSSLNYEGDASSDEYKEVEDMCSSADDEELGEEVYDTGDDDFFIENDSEEEIGVTRALLATARNYNSADDEEMQDAKATGKSGKNRLANAPILVPQPGIKSKRMSSKRIGQVRTVGEGDDATLEWFHPGEQQWIPAVYHMEVRDALIEAASVLGEYRHPMMGGKYGDYDVTAYHPLFKHNGPDRVDWPEILFKYLPSRSDMMSIKPDYWYLHDGRVVIDLNDDAMFDYPEMPVTLARNADPWLLLTLMRMNNTISLQDIRGRMFGNKNPSRTDPLGRNRISMNMQRFRKFACCLTWNTIRATDTQREYLDKKLPRRCHRLNSTKSYRMLESWEVAELDTKDAGKFLRRTRAKHRDVSKARSQAVYEHKAHMAEILKKAFDRIHPHGVPNDYDTEDEEYQALEASLPATPPLPTTEKNKSADTKFVNLKGNPAPASAKASGRKKQKTDPMPAFKNFYVLSDATSPNPVLDKGKKAQCPGGHRNYAGFVTTAPNSVEDAQLLHDLLAPTRRHFQKCTRLEAPRTEGDACYNCQHRQIQDDLVDWHCDQPGLDYVPVCQLVRILYVNDRMLYWNVKWNSKWFGERPHNALLARLQTDGHRYW